jgi:hypothetical protein
LSMGLAVCSNAPTPLPRESAVKRGRFHPLDGHQGAPGGPPRGASPRSG